MGSFVSLPIESRKVIPNVNHIGIFFGSWMKSFIALVGFSCMAENCWIQRFCNVSNLREIPIVSLFYWLYSSYQPWSLVSGSGVRCSFISCLMLVALSLWVTESSRIPCQKCSICCLVGGSWTSAFRLIIYLTIKFLRFFIEEFILLIVVTCLCISS